MTSNQSLVAAAVVGLFAAGPQLSVAQFWDGGFGDDPFGTPEVRYAAFTEANSQWNQGLNWSLNQVPVNSLTNDVTIGDTTNPIENPDPDNIPSTPDAAFVDGIAVQAAELRIGNGTNTTARFTVQPGGSVELGEEKDLVVGDNQGSGFVTFNPGSTLVASRSIILGKRDGLTFGSVVARGSTTNATTLNTRGLVVGDIGGGQLIIEGADINNTGNLRVGNEGIGEVTLRGHDSGAMGELSAFGRFLIADRLGASGEFTQQANSIFNADIDTVFRIGDVGPGTYNMEGGTLNVTNTSSVAVQIGHGATGMLNQSGGEVIAANTVALGTAGATGTYDQTGGSLDAGLLVVGSSSQGVFNAGGEVDIVGNVVVGSGGSSQGELTLTDGGDFTANLRVLIGDEEGSVGVVTQQAGSTFTSTTSRTDRPFRVGEGGDGTYNMEGGLLELANGGQVIQLAAFGGSTGTFNMTGGTVITPDITVGGGTPSFDFAAGEIFLDGDRTGFDAANAWFNVTGDTSLYTEEFLSATGQTRLFFDSGDVLGGDYNNDGVVNAADYTVWRDNFGQPAGSLMNDIDGDQIGVAQYETWRANFGEGMLTGGSSAEVNATPEPTSVVALLGLLAFRRSRRREPRHPARRRSSARACGVA